MGSVIPHCHQRSFADYSELKNYFANDYDVSINYFRDKDQVDYLVVPDPFVPFDNEK